MSLDRFIDAQFEMYPQALQEIKDGRKRSHWMWFIWPQITGLGSSQQARAFAITDRKEAEDFIKHAVLGQRLIEITQAFLKIKDSSVLDILGNPDNLKMKSSMTLFHLIQSDNGVFQEVLSKYFDNKLCEHTRRMIQDSH